MIIELMSDTTPLGPCDLPQTSASDRYRYSVDGPPARRTSSAAYARTTSPRTR